MNEIQPILAVALYCLAAIVLIAWVLVPFVLFDIRRELQRANDTLEREYVLLFQLTRANAQPAIE